MTSFWTEKKNYDPTLVFIAIPKPSTPTGVCKRLALNVRQFAINMSFRDRCSDRHFRLRESCILQASQTFSRHGTTITFVIQTGKQGQRRMWGGIRSPSPLSLLTRCPYWSVLTGTYWASWFSDWSVRLLGMRNRRYARDDRLDMLEKCKPTEVLPAGAMAHTARSKAPLPWDPWTCHGILKEKVEEASLAVVFPALQRLSLVRPSETQYVGS